VRGADWPNTFAGFPLSHTQPTDKHQAIQVDQVGRKRIKVKACKDFVFIG
jgi:hypothetical protein